MATPCCSFETLATLGRARTGLLNLTHGQVPTPAFMPVGTRGSVKGVHPTALREMGASLVLANTFHLWERPGHETVQALGEIRRFMGWDGPVLTDSGGYQVFSLKKMAKVSEEGVAFRSPLDGSKRYLTPEISIEIQETLGVDVAMAFDECLEWPATRDRTARSTARTTRWLKRCIDARQRADRTAVFGIVQGGMYDDLRKAHAEEIAELNLDGYAIGGLSVGEGHDEMMRMVDVAAPALPEGKVRYLMGVGQPADLIEAIARGIDLFDCVLPTRAGRHAQAYTWDGRLQVTNTRFALDPRPLDPRVPTSPANAFSRGYLRHLFKAGEPLGKRLLSEHNLAFYQQIMAEARACIASGDEAAFEDLRRRCHVASGKAPKDA